MDNRQKKQAERLRERNNIVIFIIALIAVFLLLLFMNRPHPEIEHTESPYEEDVKTYEGSLNRNVTNPFGAE